MPCSVDWKRCQEWPSTQARNVRALRENDYEEEKAGAFFSSFSSSCTCSCSCSSCCCWLQQWLLESRFFCFPLLSLYWLRDPCDFPKQYVAANIQKHHLSDSTGLNTRTKLCFKTFKNLLPLAGMVDVMNLEVYLSRSRRWNLFCWLKCQFFWHLYGLLILDSRPLKLFGHRVQWRRKQDDKLPWARMLSPAG